MFYNTRECIPHPLLTTLLQYVHSEAAMLGYSDPRLVQDQGMYDTFAARPRPFASRQSTYPYILLVVVVLIGAFTVGWRSEGVQSAATNAYTIVRAIPNPVGAMRRTPSSVRPQSPVRSRASTSFDLNSFPKQRESSVSDDKPPAATKWWANKVDRRSVDKKNHVRNVAASASAMAVLLSSMSPESTQAFTEVVDSRYVMAAADALQDAARDVSGVESAIQRSAAGHVRAPEVVDSVRQVAPLVLVFMFACVRFLFRPLEFDTVCRWLLGFAPPILVNTYTLCKKRGLEGGAEVPKWSVGDAENVC